jgi:glutathione S-transferase
VSPHFEVIADRLVNESTLMPCGFGLADILLMSCLDWAIAYGVALPPALRGYYECHNTRPAYQRAMKINYPDLFGGDA